MTASPTLVWLRNDLRIADNPALHAAEHDGRPVIAIYVHETDPELRPVGAATRWWLHHSLVALEADLAQHGIVFEVLSGQAGAVLEKFAHDKDAAAIHWNRRYAPAERDLDAAIKSKLRKTGITVTSHPGNLLVEPWMIETGQHKPYSVFTPFWKSLRNIPIEAPLPAPKKRAARKTRSVDGGYDIPFWAPKMAQYWTIGEAGARDALGAFLDERLADYPDGRDIPAKDLTSRLSPHLRFGEISPRQIWRAARMRADAEPTLAGPVEKFLSELAWREFSYHQLYHRQDIAEISMQRKYEGMRWRHAPNDLAAWQAGQTGIPIIDAGMRELWETGYMHNRVRMLVASFLSKNLLTDWRLGEKWFWDCLVDADMANNPASWQWVAGSGLDAAPYFRIFNPVTQGERFDASGDYVRRWVPEIAELSDKFVHKPWEAAASDLTAEGIVLGKTYPRPIADLKATRQRALDASAALS
ncbi:deoxyribodipyrimidine photo-lyase [Devosia sp. 63-57]|uniref:cryptochrome/photolyase family protein n=1 Tax=Devosia sp. 63-57 TaxID=1895751 RepID=UPI00086FA2A0|nr:deoxyribodipyrimidine photo-lyase [Devosia sp. 63-57]ODT49114.1 MAG: deoxyribodipyrimidine photolyase [Pelagibacterium sp. SCN 63-126]ODU83558.1 MAG: deoxyribodipyrimidine photolyase [Pelagibacterium sp. SCN 63-17]OJX43368.1 MAG: deoxyribodipyrimidine photolyase [Devosia sp. 63-57]